MDYKFKFTRSAELIVEADNEDAAWALVAQLNPDTVATGWDIVLDTEPPVEPAIDQGPAEIDDWDASDPFHQL
jgi:hypothetical protein